MFKVVEHIRHGSFESRNFSIGTDLPSAVASVLRMSPYNDGANAYQVARIIEDLRSTDSADLGWATYTYEVI